MDSPAAPGKFTAAATPADILGSFANPIMVPDSPVNPVSPHHASINRVTPRQEVLVNGGRKNPDRVAKQKALPLIKRSIQKRVSIVLVNISTEFH
jgi:hypothetical protein